MAVDFTTKSAAPRPKPATSRAKTPPKLPEPEKPSDQVRREQAAKNLFEFAQIASVFKGWYADAATYAMHGPKVSSSMAAYAEQNRYVAKGLDVLDILGPAFVLADVLLPLGLQLAVNHKKLPADALVNFGVVSPDMLEAQAKASIAQQQVEAMKAQIQAERDLAAANAEAEHIIAGINGAELSPVSQ